MKRLTIFTSNCYGYASRAAGFSRSKVQDSDYGCLTFSTINSRSISPFHGLNNHYIFVHTSWCNKTLASLIRT